MNRRLQLVNLIGVLILAGLCAAQWRRDRALNLELNQSLKAQLEQKQRITESEKNLRGLTEDLGLLKEQLIQTKAESGEARKSASAAEREISELTQARDQLRQSVTNWSRAVADRDAKITEANTRISDLAGRLNDSIRKFNDLATNHNAVVARFNQLAQTLQTNAPPSLQK